MTGGTYVETESGEFWYWHRDRESKEFALWGPFPTRKAAKANRRARRVLDRREAAGLVHVADVVDDAKAGRGPAVVPLLRWLAQEVYAGDVFIPSAKEGSTCERFGMALEKLATQIEKESAA